MKLPANVLALCLMTTAGCETAVDFERRSAPPRPTATKGVPERIEIVQEQPAYAQPPPAAAPITTPAPVTKTRSPKPVAAPRAHICGPCGMG